MSALTILVDKIFYSSFKKPLTLLSGAFLLNCDMLYTLKQIEFVILPILKKHKVTRAGIFGSFAKNKATAQSDIDILVELTYPMSLLDFVGLKLELEDALGQSVDLVEYKAIKPIIKDSILESEIRIYG